MSYTNEGLNAQCILGSANGVYIPQIFAERYEDELLQQFDHDQVWDLLNGPKSEYYWNSWEFIIDNFTLDGKVLIQDEDLFLVDEDDAEYWTYI